MCNEDRRFYPKLGKEAETDRSTPVKIQKVRLVYFSPTKTTKAILKSIADGIRADAVKHVNVALPNVDRHNFPEMEADELPVIGAPVYAGRIPEISREVQPEMMR